MEPVAEEQKAMPSFTSKKARTFRLNAALEVSLAPTCWQLERVVLNFSFMPGDEKLQGTHEYCDDKPR